MRRYVGFDVGKDAHWACVLDAEGEVIISRKVEATEEALEAVCEEIAALGVADEERVLGIDLVGGQAALLEAVLLERGERVRYIPGTAVNKAREAYAGGEQKSDPRTPSSSPTSSGSAGSLSRRFAFGMRTSPSCGRWSPTGGTWCRIRLGA